MLCRKVWCRKLWSSIPVEVTFCHLQNCTKCPWESLPRYKPMTCWLRSCGNFIGQFIGISIPDTHIDWSWCSLHISENQIDHNQSIISQLVTLLHVQTLQTITKPISPNWNYTYHCRINYMECTKWFAHNLTYYIHM